MLVVSRFPSVDSPAGSSSGADNAANTAATGFLAAGQRALEVLAAQRGFRSGRLARAADDPRAWVLITEWESIGAWRRALSAYEVKLESTPLLAQAADEPSAYEVLVAIDDRGTVITGSDRTD